MVMKGKEYRILIQNFSPISFLKTDPSKKGRLKCQSAFKLKILFTLYLSVHVNGYLLPLSVAQNVPEKYFARS